MKLYPVEHGESVDLALYGRAARHMLLRHENGWDDSAETCAMRHEVANAVASDLDGEVIDIQVRSNQSDVYGGAMRHYYLRIGNIIEFHPGTPQRLSLVGWNSGTLHRSDVLEYEARLCRHCANALLNETWSQSRNFHIVWNNCDQLLNGTQTKVIALLTFEFVTYVTLGDVIGTILVLLMALGVAIGARWWNEQTVRERSRRYVCSHVDDERAPSVATRAYISPTKTRRS